MLNVKYGDLLIYTGDARSQRYSVLTETKVQVQEMVYTNKVETDCRLNILDRLKEGYIVRVEVLSSIQSGKDALSEVITDLNSLNKVLDLRLDANGNMISLLNKNELLLTWKAMLPIMLKKYNAKHPAFPLIQNMENQLKDENSLLESLLYKGVYGILFPGIYGFDYSRQPVRVKKTIPSYLGNISLALHQKTRIQDADFPIFTLLRNGEIDDEVFDHESIRKTIRQILDAPNYQVILTIVNEEQYEVSADTGFIVRAAQLLRTEVKGVYFNEVTHTLKSKEDW